MAAAVEQAWLRPTPGSRPLAYTRGAGGSVLRVDNWGNFLSQRIHELYDKQEYCDLTLRFDKCDFKAHSLVLHAFTPFFTSLLKGKTSGHKILKMPPQISSDTMSVILKFVYTGKVEATIDLDELLRTARLLKLQILTRLLETQRQGSRPVTTTLDVNGLRRPAPAGRAGRAGRATPKDASTMQATVQTILSPLTPKRSSLVPAAGPPTEARPSRFEMPEEPCSSPPRVSLANTAARSAHNTPTSPATGGATTEAGFDSLRQSASKRPAPAASPHVNGGEKRQRSDDGEDMSTLKEHYVEQRRRAQLLGQVPPDEAAAPTADGADSSAAAAATPRPILKQEPAPDTPGTPSSGAGKKRVQFSESTQVTVSVPDGTQVSQDLVNELLRQHPEIMRSGQNVKVHVMTKSGGRSRSQYITVQRPDSSAAAAAAAGRSAPLICSLCSRGDAQLQFATGEEMTKHFRETHSDPSGIDLNTLSCTVCERVGDPQAFASVEHYLAHVAEVHTATTPGDTEETAAGAHITAQECSRCNFSCANRLQFMYHEFTRHQVPPPRFINFPKCERCDFVAMTEPDLSLHRQKQHRLVREYKCKDCSGTFPTIAHLEQHMRQKDCKPTPEMRKRVDQWKCEFCGMYFSRCYNLKAHLRSVHRSETAREQTKQTLTAAPPVKVEPQPAADAAPLDPSSEAEAMSTVASGVATSLGLAVDGEYMTLPDGVVPVEDEHGQISYIALRPADAAGAVAGGSVVELAQYAMPVVMRTQQAGQLPTAGSSAGEAVLPDLCLATSSAAMELPQTSAAQPVALLTSAHQPAAAASATSTVYSSQRGQMAGLVSSSRITVSGSEYTEEPVEEEPPTQLYQHPDTGQLYAAIRDADGTTTLVPHNPDGTPALPQLIQDDVVHQQQNLAEMEQQHYEQVELVHASPGTKDGLSGQDMHVMAPAEPTVDPNVAAEEVTGGGEAILGMESSHDHYRTEIHAAVTQPVEIHPSSQSIHNQAGLAELAAVAADAGHIQVSQHGREKGHSADTSLESTNAVSQTLSAPDNRLYSKHQVTQISEPITSVAQGHQDVIINPAQQTTGIVVSGAMQTSLEQPAVMRSAMVSRAHVVPESVALVAPPDGAGGVSTSAGGAMLLVSGGGEHAAAVSSATTADGQLVLVLGDGAEAAGWPAGQILVETADGRQLAGQTLQYVDGRQVSLIVQQAGEQYVPEVAPPPPPPQQVLVAAAPDGVLAEMDGAELVEEVVVAGQPPADAAGLEQAPAEAVVDSVHASHEVAASQTVGGVVSDTVYALETTQVAAADGVVEVDATGQELTDAAVEDSSMGEVAGHASVETSADLTVAETVPEHASTETAIEHPQRNPVAEHNPMEPVSDQRPVGEMTADAERTEAPAPVVAAESAETVEPAAPDPGDGWDEVMPPAAAPGSVALSPATAVSAGAGAHAARTRL